MNTKCGASDYVDASDGATALVAAVLVVAWDHPELIGKDAAYGLEAWPRAEVARLSHLRVQAAAVADRLSNQESNELAELWAEEDQLADFRDEVSRWRGKL
ncbi:DUF4259 domain-containing protein [Paenarthrobacter nicotinovorans]|uniref:DUF4259 domain-containing protein n=1 Tax=Paenarthrobacter nicotinovorans TaxID=29320 RepID=UPI003593E098